MEAKLPPAPEGIAPYEFPVISPAALKFPWSSESSGFRARAEVLPRFFSPCIQKYDLQPSARGGKHP